MSGPSETSIRTMTSLRFKRLLTNGGCLQKNRTHNAEFLGRGPAR